MRPTCFQRDRIERALIEDDLSRSTDTRLDYSIEAITPKEAADFIRRFEYLGTPGRNWFAVGARNASGELAAVAIFGRPVPMAPNEIVLERGACTLWSAPNTASWFIPKAVTMAAQDRGWQIFYAYADPAAGEVGTIYRACSWTYLGQGSPGRRSRPREYYQRGGERPITERAFRKRGYILADMDLLGWRRIMVPPKHRYAHVEIWRNGYHDKRAERALSIRLKNKRTS